MPSCLFWPELVFSFPYLSHLFFFLFWLWCVLLWIYLFFFNPAWDSLWFLILRIYVFHPCFKVPLHYLSRNCLFPLLSIFCFWKSVHQTPSLRYWDWAFALSFGSPTSPIAQIFNFLCHLLCILFSSIFCLANFLSCFSECLLLKASSSLARRQVFSWQSTRMYDLVKPHSWLLQRRAQPNVVLSAKLLAQWHPQSQGHSPSFAFWRYYIPLERSDLLIEVSVLLCSTCDHSYSACKSLPQGAGKCLRPWMKRSMLVQWLYHFQGQQILFWNPDSSTVYWGQ